MVQKHQKNPKINDFHSFSIKETEKGFIQTTKNLGPLFIINSQKTRFSLINLPFLTKSNYYNFYILLCVCYVMVGVCYVI